MSERISLTKDEKAGCMMVELINRAITNGSVFNEDYIAKDSKTREFFGVATLTERGHENMLKRINSKNAPGTARVRYLLTNNNI